MLIVASDWYIIDILGPYLAKGKNNNAPTLNKHLSKKQCNNIFKWSQSNDVLVLDRGFRDWGLPSLASDADKDIEISKKCLKNQN